MAKKKTSKQKAVPPQEFTSSPFKKLKGLSALVAQKTVVPGDLKPVDKVVEPEVVAIRKDLAFADEMAFLGVKPLSGKVPAVPAAVGAVDSPPALKPTSEGEDDAIFLQAVGTLEKTFKDEWPEESPARSATPRRMRQVVRGLLKPEAELDLHGLTVDAAGIKARFFLQDALYQGFQTVLIITGKGLHSSDGPVLRQAMEKFLDQQRDTVLEWGIAPRQYGADGALVVFLRRRAVE